MNTLEGKVALVVDATSEVGSLVTRTLARHSVTLSLIGVETTRLHELATECHRIGLAENRILTITLSDLHNKDEIQSAVAQTARTFNTIHSLVHLSDNDCNKTFAETTMDDLNSMHVSHVESPLLWLQHCLKYLKKTKGNVVVLSSGYSRQSVVGMFPYAISKAAADNLVRTMALDLANYEIRVNSLCPLYPPHEKPEAEREREAITRNIAEYVAYLSTDVASFITGQCIPIGSVFNIDMTVTAS